MDNRKYLSVIIDNICTIAEFCGISFKYIIYKFESKINDYRVIDSNESEIYLFSHDSACICIYDKKTSNIKIINMKKLHSKVTIIVEQKLLLSHQRIFGLSIFNYQTQNEILIEQNNISKLYYSNGEIYVSINGNKIKKYEKGKIDKIIFDRNEYILLMEPYNNNSLIVTEKDVYILDKNDNIKKLKIKFPDYLLNEDNNLSKIKSIKLIKNLLYIVRYETEIYVLDIYTKKDWIIEIE